jgi:tRNA A-37 threonylcarbamoyl transferase component Bud32
MKTTNVIDPFGAAEDQDLPTIRAALDPEKAGNSFKHGLPRLAGAEGRISIKAIEVIRHKPGKRCILQYQVKVRQPGREPKRVVLIGKIRARRFGNEGYRLQDALWNAGFQADSSDGISVPEPIGVLGDLRMWLQRRVEGEEVTTLLAGPERISLMDRVAEAVHKLHRSGLRAERRHLIEDELRILHEKLPSVSAQLPSFSERIEKVLSGCDRLGRKLPVPEICGIHRDFYPAQIIYDQGRLHLIDFDLFTDGDPALDVGNFIGHVTEISLRTLGKADGLADCEQALEDRFVQLSGERCRASVRGYTLLTLVRHIFLSTQFPDRKSTTEPLLEICEHRLAEAGCY